MGTDSQSFPTSPVLSGSSSPWTKVDTKDPQNWKYLKFSLKGET